MKLRRCDICGSPFHKTQPTPNWVREYLIVWAICFVVLLAAILGALALVGRLA